MNFNTRFFGSNFRHQFQYTNFKKNFSKMFNSSFNSNGFMQNMKSSQKKTVLMLNKIQIKNFASIQNSSMIIKSLPFLRIGTDSNGEINSTRNLNSDVVGVLTTLNLLGESISENGM